MIVPYRWHHLEISDTTPDTLDEELLQSDDCCRVPGEYEFTQECFKAWKMKILVFAIVGACLLTANLWYFQSLRRMLSTQEIPEVISAFQFVGAADEGAVKGRALASMLAARIDVLQTEIRSARDELKRYSKPNLASVTEGSSTGRPAVVRDTAATELSLKVIDVPDIQLQVSGIDFTGIFSWLYRELSEGRSIKVTVHQKDGTEQCTLAANLSTEGIPQIWLEQLSKDESHIVDELAIEVVRQQVIRGGGIPQAAGLDRNEFRDLINVLSLFGKLASKEDKGIKVRSDEYLSVANKLGPLAERAPKWKAILAITAFAYEKAAVLEHARKLYQQQLELADLEPAESKWLQDKVKELTNALLPPTSSPANRNANELILSSLWSANPNSANLATSAIKTQTPDSTNTAESALRVVRIGIVGGQPSNHQLKLLGNAAVGEELGVHHGPISDHVGKVASVIHSLAPNAEFVFSPSAGDWLGSMGVGNILWNCNDLLEKGADVIVIPLLIQQDGKEVFGSFLKQATNMGVIVVLPAGNSENTQQSGMSLLANTEFVDKAIVVGAVNRSGEIARFSLGKEVKGCLWALGENIPIQVASNDDTVIKVVESGTSYSAAVAAAAIAQLLERDFNMRSLETVREALTRMSAELILGGPSVLSLEPSTDKAPQ